MRIGILGGGQLARMMALSGKPLGLNFVFYEPRDEHCVSHLGDIVKADYDDFQGMNRFAEQVDVITIENENIPCKTVEYLKNQKPVYPGVNALSYAQDRFYEKSLMSELNIAIPECHTVHSQAELTQAAEALGFPFVLKTRRGGYDGKGQWRFKNAEALSTFELADNDFGFLAEQHVAFEREVSLIAVRALDGDIRYYPLCENAHEDGILVTTTVSGQDNLQSEAEAKMKTVLEQLKYVGVLVIEFFVKDGQLLVNEMAPRVHNSGHWSIEGAVCSQFENHCRAIAGLPLGDTRLIAPVTMNNIIGDWPDSSALLKQAGLHLHDYQKSPRAGRKLGHVTILSDA